jgi:Spy/CpxP family protein refolding chaperone
MKITMTMFRKPMMRTAVLAFCTTALGTLPMMAQDTPAAAPQQDQAGPPMGGRGGPGREEHQVEMLTKRLSLTPDQVTQVKAIDDDTMKQTRAVREDESIARPDKRAKMMDIRKASQDKIRAVLTDEQKTKYDAMLAQMQQRRENGQGGPGGPPPAPPQQ